MPARTYSTDVCLTCPCPGCEGRSVRITLRKFRSLSRLTSQSVSRSCTSSCRDATTGNSGPSRRSAKPPAKTSAFRELSGTAMGRLDQH